MTELIQNADTLFRDFQLITMRNDRSAYGLIENGAVAVSDGVITWIGSDTEAGNLSTSARMIQGKGRFLSPGLIDCHSHLIWGGSRADEWERRLGGESYEEIAKQGGGILSTVAATRLASEDQLLADARDRLQFLISQGVTTCEIKSGYGLNTESEQKMLNVAHRLDAELPVDISITFLGAHTVPAEFRGKSDDYVELVCHEMIPAVADHCQAVDVFCETIGFSLAQTERVFRAAQDHGRAIKVHAEQLSNTGSARLAAEMGAWSADHLEYLDEDGVRAMADRGTVAVLLPGAFYFIRETQLPPISLLREHGVPIAVATDANPGSSPVASITMAMNMACTLFGLTPAEALTGVTRNAARAIRVEDRTGSIEVGKQADLAAWEISHPAELAYGIGHNPCKQVYKRGKLIYEAVC